MTFWQRKENFKEIKERKRLRWAIFIFGVILVFFGLGFLKRYGLIPSLNLFSSSQILRPIPSQNLEEELQRNLQKAGLESTKTFFLGREIDASLSSGVAVTFSQEKDLALQVASLQLILQRFKIEGKTPKKIDLRFNKPIVTF